MPSSCKSIWIRVMFVCLRTMSFLNKSLPKFAHEKQRLPRIIHEEKKENVMGYWSPLIKTERIQEKRRWNTVSCKGDGNRVRTSVWGRETSCLWWWTQLFFFLQFLLCFSFFSLLSFPILFHAYTDTHFFTALLYTAIIWCTYTHYILELYSY